MARKLVITLIVFLLFGAAVLGAGFAVSPEAVALPGPITAESTCPVAGCTQPDGSCHADVAYPVPDGTFVMACPHIKGCTGTECHAFDRIEQAGHPSDASLNLWIIAPTLVVVGLVAFLRRL
jgi:hypothetical protein